MVFLFLFFFIFLFSQTKPANNGDYVNYYHSMYVKEYMFREQNFLSIIFYAHPATITTRTKTNPHTMRRTSTLCRCKKVIQKTAIYANRIRKKKKNYGIWMVYLQTPQYNVILILSTRLHLDSILSFIQVYCTIFWLNINS